MLERTKLQSETILVVEDNTLLRDVISRILRNYSFNVLETADGIEALRLVQEDSDQVIHLLLIDVILPLMGGEELARRFHILRPETRVLFTSGMVDFAFLNDDDSLPPVNFLQKPFTPDELIGMVRKILEDLA